MSGKMDYCGSLHQSAETKETELITSCDPTNFVESQYSPLLVNIISLLSRIKSSAPDILKPLLVYSLDVVTCPNNILPRSVHISNIDR